MVRERGVVEEGVFFKERNRGFAELVERCPVATWFRAGKFLAEADAVLEDFAFLSGRQLWCALAYMLAYNRLYFNMWASNALRGNNRVAQSHSHSPRCF